MQLTHCRRRLLLRYRRALPRSRRPERSLNISLTAPSPDLDSILFSYIALHPISFHLKRQDARNRSAGTGGKRHTNRGCRRVLQDKGTVDHTKGRRPQAMKGSRIEKSAAVGAALLLLAGTPVLAQHVFDGNILWNNYNNGVLCNIDRAASNLPDSRPRNSTSTSPTTTHWTRSWRIPTAIPLRAGFRRKRARPAVATTRWSLQRQHPPVRRHQLPRCAFLGRDRPGVLPGSRAAGLDGRRLDAGVDVLQRHRRRPHGHRLHQARRISRRGHHAARPGFTRTTTCAGRINVDGSSL